MRKAEKEPRNAMTLPNPGKTIAVRAQMAVVAIRETRR